MRARTNQGGWIVSFAVVGMLLVLGLITTAYVLKSYHADTDELANNGAETSEQDGATDNEGNASKPDESKEETKKDDSDVADNDSKSGENNIPEAGERVANDEENTTDTNATEDSEEKTDSEAETLPETGTADVAISTIAVGALTYSAVLYRRSRH